MESQMEEYGLDVKDRMYKAKEKSVADELPGGEVADEGELLGRDARSARRRRARKMPCQARQRLNNNCREADALPEWWSPPSFGARTLGRGTPQSMCRRTDVNAVYGGEVRADRHAWKKCDDMKKTNNVVKGQGRTRRTSTLTRRKIRKRRVDDDGAARRERQGEDCRCTREVRHERVRTTISRQANARNKVVLMMYGGK
eukprot:14045576-Heterocapsa_arctica.AAC.1